MQPKHSSPHKILFEADLELMAERRNILSAFAAAVGLLYAATTRGTDAEMESVYRARAREQAKEVIGNLQRWLMDSGPAGLQLTPEDSRRLNRYRAIQQNVDDSYPRCSKCGGSLRHGMSSSGLPVCLECVSKG